MNLLEELFKNRDEKYQVFQAKLIPNIPAETIIGVRTPKLREIAKAFAKEPEVKEFLRKLPHDYYEENQVHIFIVSQYKNFDECVEAIEAFLPYIDNWAVCDQRNPKVFSKNHEKMIPILDKWLESDHVYTARFAIGIYMSEFLDEDFQPEYLEKIAGKNTDEYYLQMMIAWYFATALAKQYEATVPYIEQKRLSPWIHRKTIQKAVESYRITDEQKAYLRTFR